MVILGKMCVTVVYSTFYVYVPELFPTVIRSTAMGLCSMMARVGAFGASYVALWLVNRFTLMILLTCNRYFIIIFINLRPKLTSRRQF